MTMKSITGLKYRTSTIIKSTGMSLWVFMMIAKQKTVGLMKTETTR